MRAKPGRCRADILVAPTALVVSGLRPVIAASLCLLLWTAENSQAQDNIQLWAEFKLSWVKSRQLAYGLDLEPKVLLSKPDDDPGWVTFGVTPSVEYSKNEWLDTVGELFIAQTRQTDDVNSTEITPRIGLRLHLLSNLREELVKEKRPRHRIVLRNLARLEVRNLFYSGDTPNKSTIRLRDRVELLCALTRARVTDDGAIYALGDAEWFWQLDDVTERYANKQRFRGGLGYRRSSAWHFESLVIWDRSRNTLDEPFASSDVVIDLTVKRVW